MDVSQVEQMIIHTLLGLSKQGPAAAGVVKVAFPEKPDERGTLASNPYYYGLSALGHTPWQEAPDFDVRVFLENMRRAFTLQHIPETQRVCLAPPWLVEHIKKLDLFPFEDVPQDTLGVYLGQVAGWLLFSIQENGMHFIQGMPVKELAAMIQAMQDELWLDQFKNLELARRN